MFDINPEILTAIGYGCALRISKEKVTLPDLKEDFKKFDKLDPIIRTRWNLATVCVLEMYKRLRHLPMVLENTYLMTTLVRPRDVELRGGEIRKLCQDLEKRAFLLNDWQSDKKPDSLGLSELVLSFTIIAATQVQPWLFPRVSPSEILKLDRATLFSWGNSAGRRWKPSMYLGFATSVLANWSNWGLEDWLNLEPWKHYRELKEDQLKLGDVVFRCVMPDMFQVFELDRNSLPTSCDTSIAAGDN